MEEIINIKGMHCNSCIKLIEDKISSLKGIEKIKVSLIENKAFVKFNSEIISLKKIKSEIQDLGYSTDGDSKKKLSKKGLLQGIAYGLIPHIGCIAFITASILGVTVAVNFFKPLLMNPWFFHILILISAGFATLSSVIYLRKNDLLSFPGVKRKWKYLSTMYGSTIGINLFLFMVIFPLLANVSVASPTGAFIAEDLDELYSIRLSVNIPCPGHAPLISGELKTIDGVAAIQFSYPNFFDVKYDSTKTTKQNMLSLEVFDVYEATVVDETNRQISEPTTNSTNRVRTGCGCGGSTCGGSGSCCGA
ncbi:MAG: hypothetical protein GTN36_05640 [Candidatus Aenigmarchaeota archaeon]|nr:hypothetical protein [Candidatus Aenigmarchaeota archaeon]